MATGSAREPTRAAPARLALLLLGLTIALGLALRLSYFTEPYILDAHGWRQSDSAAFARGYLVDTLNPLAPRADRYPCDQRHQVFGRVEAELPVASWLAALPLALAGAKHPPAPYLRAWSLAFFAGTCVYLFLLVRQLDGGGSLGVLSVLVFSLLPISVTFTRTVQPESPSLFFTAGFLYHLQLWLDRDLLRHALLAGLLGAFVLLQKISNAFVLLPAFYLIVAKHGFWGSLRQARYWLWGVALLVPVFLWYAHAAKSPWSFGIWGAGKFSSLALLGDPRVWKLFSQRLVFEILTWSGVVLLVAGFAIGWQSRMVRLAAVWLLAFVPFLLLTIPAHRTHIYYQLPLVLPAAMVIALAIQRAWRQGAAGRLLLLATVLIGLATFQHAFPIYNKQDLRVRDGVELLRRHLPEQAYVVSTDRNPMLFYNSGHRGWFSVRGANLAHLTACMGTDVEHLLLDARAEQNLLRNPRDAAELRRDFEQLERNRNYSLWRRIAGRARQDSAPSQT